MGTCWWYISPPHIVVYKIEHKLSGVHRRGHHLPEFMALHLGWPMLYALGSFLSARIPRHQRPSPQHRTNACKFIWCAEQRPPFVTVYGSALGCPVPSGPFFLKEHQRPTPFHRMHAWMQIYLVWKAGDTLATTCHSLWHWLGLPNPPESFLQKYPITIHTAQGPHKRPEHPSHFHHHYQHLCSTLVRWNCVAHCSHTFIKQLHIGQINLL